MYHSVNFYDGTTKFNAYSTWGLVPETRLIVAPPEPKTKYLDLPGNNGTIDLTESLTGYPTFNDREGEWTFYVLNDYRMENVPSGIQVIVEDTQDSHGGTIRNIYTVNSYDPVTPEGFANWAAKLTAIMEAIQGKKVKAVLEDDPNYCYVGRFYVSDWDSSGETYSTITISYIVEPYKRGCREISGSGGTVYLQDTGDNTL